MGVTQSQQSENQLDSGNSGSAPAWLNELNWLRATGGLAPVAENAGLSSDCDGHAKYLVEQGPPAASQFVTYEMALGLGAHHEDPASPHFSESGAECAAGGKPAPGVAQSNDVAWGRDPIDDLDGLFYDAPFHRLSLVASWATVAGYGTYGDYPRRVGTLALRGEGGIGSPLIRFPTDGSTVPVGQVRNFEIPNPLSSCPGYILPVGLPITVQLGSGYRGRMLSYSVRGPAGAVETCGFDWDELSESRRSDRGGRTENSQHVRSDHSYTASAPCERPLFGCGLDRAAELRMEFHSRESIVGRDAMTDS